MRPGPVLGRPPGPRPIHPTFEVGDAAAITSTSSVCLLICKKPPKRQSASPSRPVDINSHLSPSDGGGGLNHPPDFNPKSTSTSPPLPWTPAPGNDGRHRQGRLSIPEAGLQTNSALPMQDGFSPRSGLLCPPSPSPSPLLAAISPSV